MGIWEAGSVCAHPEGLDRVIDEALADRVAHGHHTDVQQHAGVGADKLDHGDDLHGHEEPAEREEDGEEVIVDLKMFEYCFGARLLSIGEEDLVSVP